MDASSYSERPVWLSAVSPDPIESPEIGQDLERKEQIVILTSFVHNRIWLEETKICFVTMVNGADDQKVYRSLREKSKVNITTSQMKLSKRTYHFIFLAVPFMQCNHHGTVHCTPSQMTGNNYRCNCNCWCLLILWNCHTSQSPDGLLERHDRIKSYQRWTIELMQTGSQQVSRTKNILSSHKQDDVKT